MTVAVASELGSLGHSALGGTLLPNKTSGMGSGTGWLSAASARVGNAANFQSDWNSQLAALGAGLRENELAEDGSTPGRSAGSPVDGNNPANAETGSRPGAVWELSPQPPGPRAAPAPPRVVSVPLSILPSRTEDNPQVSVLWEQSSVSPSQEVQTSRPEMQESTAKSSRRTEAAPSAQPRHRSTNALQPGTQAGQVLPYATGVIRLEAGRQLIQKPTQAPSRDLSLRPVRGATSEQISPAIKEQIVEPPPAGAPLAAPSLSVAAGPAPPIFDPIPAATPTRFANRMQFVSESPVAPAKASTGPPPRPAPVDNLTSKLPRAPGLPATREINTKMGPAPTPPQASLVPEAATRQVDLPPSPGATNPPIFAPVGEPLPVTAMKRTAAASAAAGINPDATIQTPAQRATQQASAESVVEPSFVGVNPAVGLAVTERQAIRSRAFVSTPPPKATVEIAGRTFTKQPTARPSVAASGSVASGSVGSGPGKHGVVEPPINGLVSKSPTPPAVSPLESTLPAFDNELAGELDKGLDRPAQAAADINPSPSPTPAREPHEASSVPTSAMTQNQTLSEPPAVEQAKLQLRAEVSTDDAATQAAGVAGGSPYAAANMTGISSAASANPVKRAHTAAHTDRNASSLSQLAPPSGDALIVARDPDGNRAMEGPLSGQGSAAPGGGLRDAFATIDDGPGVPAWTHASSHQAEAGFEDPSLGWIGVRADKSGGGLHASLVPSSADAAQELGSHMEGLNAYLASQHASVNTLGVATPEGRSFASSHEQGSSQRMNGDAEQGSGTGQGLSQGMQQGTNQGSNQDSNQGVKQDAHPDVRHLSGTEAGTSAFRSTAKDSHNSRAPSPPASGWEAQSGSSGRNGGHISVIA